MQSGGQPASLLEPSSFPTLGGNDFVSLANTAQLLSALFSRIILES